MLSPEAISLSDLALQVDRYEVESSLEMFRAAQAETVKQCGLAWKETDFGTLFRADATESIAFNRVMMTGIDRPLTEDDLESIMDFYHQGRKTFAIQWPATARPENFPALLESRGFFVKTKWVEMVRDTSPFETMPAGLDIRLATEEDLVFAGKIICQAFSLPDVFASLIHDMHKVPCWKIFVAYAGEEPIGTGSLYARGDFGYLAMAVTLPEHRREGAQLNLLNARITYARDIGCRRVGACTAEDFADGENPSLHNMLNIGFTELYRRPNYFWKGEDAAA